MLKHLLFILIFFVSIVMGTFAESVKIKSFTLELPGGFTGPIRQSAGPTEMWAFSKSHESSETNSLIQFSIINLDEASADDPVRPPTVTNKDLLLKMLAGIERRRTDFWKGNYKEIKLAGIPANKIEWSGSVENFKMKGVYYTFIYERFLYAISLQDIMPFADDHLPLMQKSIELIKK